MSSRETRVAKKQKKQQREISLTAQQVLKDLFPNSLASRPNHVQSAGDGSCSWTVPSDVSEIVDCWDIITVKAIDSIGIFVRTIDAAACLFDHRMWQDITSLDWKTGTSMYASLNAKRGRVLNMANADTYLPELQTWRNMLSFPHYHGIEVNGVRYIAIPHVHVVGDQEEIGTQVRAGDACFPSFTLPPPDAGISPIDKSYYYRGSDTGNEISSPPIFCRSIEVRANSRAINAST